MTNRTWDEPPDDDPGELGFLLDISARVLVKSSDPAAFLDWIANAGPSVAPAMAAEIDPSTGPLGLAFRAIGVAIYNAMPQPEAGFSPRKLPVPGRNEPCLCGSGTKYKRCCLPLAGIVDLSDYNMLRHILDNVPQKRFGSLPQSRVDPFAVGDTARQWQEQGATKRAVALLEPWFAGSTALSAKLESLFDQLMDCYLELGNSRKRERLVAQVIERGDKVLRAVALQRRSTMLADQGDMVEAWNVFGEAQRADPDNPSHAPLELTLLMSQGETDRARERARFWLGRLERMRDPDLGPLIEFVRAVRDDPHSAMSSLESARFAGLDELEELFAGGAPAVESHYTVQDQGEEECMLQPTAVLRKLEERWCEVFPQVKPSLTATQSFADEMWDDPEEWLDFLARNPLAWQSFEVLDDLVLALDALPSIVAGATILEHLLARNVALLEVILGPIAKDGGTLAWGWQENRPALRLLAQRAYRALDDQTRGVASDEFIEHAEMLLALNPNDNHGIREPLSCAYLTRGWPDKAVALTDRYPDDFCGPTLNRILALLSVGREADAREALMVAAAHHEVALKMLIAEKPRPPKVDNDFGIVLGGKQEAWLYRTSARALWDRDGRLDWLKKALKKARR